MIKFLKKYLYYLYTCLVLFLGLFLGWEFVGKTFRGIDDANIYFIYMRNLSDGLGFVYQEVNGNVEGFTSLTWTLLGSVLYKINENIHVSLLFLNLGILFLLTISVYEFLINDFKRDYKIYYLFFISLLVLSPGFITWNIFSLLETGFWTLIITSLTMNILYSSDRKNNIIYFNFYLFLLIFIRPEALLLSFLFLLGKYLSFFYEYRKVNFKQFLISLIVVLLGLSILYSWRYINFKVLFPNTYYAKVNGSFYEKSIDGLMYNYSFFKENIIWLLLLFISIGYLLDKSIKIKSLSKYEFNIIFLILILLFSVFVPTLVGGDHFGLYRFFQPYTPCFILLYIYLINNFFKSKHKNIILIFLLLISIVGSKYSTLKTYNSIENLPSKIEWGIVKINRKQAILLNRFFNESDYPSLGVLAAGAMPYYYNGFSIDLLGLNNVEMAHSPKNSNGPKNHSSFNKKIFYKLKPDLIVSNIEIFEYTQNFDKSFIRIGDWESRLLNSIQNDSLFKKEYRSYILEDKNNRIVLKAYLRRDFVDRVLKINNRYVILDQ